ncbi:hypothetical protein QUF70_09175 [Desulfobacterales bacterium HSG17]|nr:hypothetical protein [Desulfobacterales bacterium HSG17]
MADLGSFSGREGRCHNDRNPFGDIPHGFGECFFGIWRHCLLDTNGVIGEHFSLHRAFADSLGTANAITRTEFSMDVGFFNMACDLYTFYAP